MQPTVDYCQLTIGGEDCPGFSKILDAESIGLDPEGNIGLMQAVKKFDLIEKSIFVLCLVLDQGLYLRFIMDNWKLVKIGTTQVQRKLFFNLNKEKDRLSYLGFDPTPQLLAESLDVRPEQVIEMDQRLSSWDVSLESPVRADSDDEHKDFLPAELRPVDEDLSELETMRIFREQLKTFRKTLKDKELDIMDKRLLSDEPVTLQAIGEKYSISRERVRQIQARLIKKIRKYLDENAPEVGEDFMGNVQ